MRKRLFLWMAALVFSFAIVSCSSNDSNSTDPNPETPSKPVTPVTPETSKADYTFIFWGTSGACDHGDCVDMARLAYKYQQGTIGKNVNIAGLLKTTISKWDVTQSPTIDKTWYFDSEKIDKTKSIPKNELVFKYTTAAQVKKTYEDAFTALNGRVYGDTTYKLANVDSLANFIKRTAEKFPARHYVLLTFGHGGGFSPVSDTPTRTCLPDYFRDNESMTADDIVYAVKESGVKMQTLFTHSCLMGALENMAAFSQVFDYAFLSAELTFNYYFPEYMEYLTAAGDDETKMQEASHKMVDYYANYYNYDKYYTSHGFYDLKQMTNLLPILKEAASWYAENYNGADAAFIESAIKNSVICVNFGDLVNSDSIQTALLRKVRESVRGLIYGDASKLDKDDELMNAVGSIYDMMSKTYLFTYGFVMTDVLRNTLKADISKDKIAKLQDIYNRYLTTLKGMAYIGTSLKPAKADADYAYMYASPTINIFALNDKYFIPIPQEANAEALWSQMWDALKKKDDVAFAKASHELLDGTMFANYVNLNFAKYNYTSSVFDQKVGWSKFLEKLQFNPSVVTNPDRWLINDTLYK